jgi:hypothetical protein
LISRDTIVKHFDLIAKLLLMLVAIILCFILNLCKIESSMFTQIVWATVVFCGGPDIAKAVLDRYLPLKPTETKSNA